MKFTETELGTISNALRVAAERFREHATADYIVEKLKQQFARQADEANTIYQRIADEKGVQS